MNILIDMYINLMQTLCFNLFGTKKRSVAAEEILIFLLLL